MAVEKKYDGLEIAIIGIAGKFPQSNDHWQFWENLKAGKEMLHNYTDEELLQSGVPDDLIRNKSYVGVAGVVDEKENFDHGFFGYTYNEAAFMDPQIRIFHECCWSALEDAGYAAGDKTNKIGLFAGAATNSNWLIHAFSKPGDPTVDPFYLNMITHANFISSLIAYKMDLKGPCYYIDTACSTSLAAVHLACRSLLTRECSIALAGGIAVSSRKEKGYLFQEGMISSRDGHCRTFDARSSGTATGEGGAVVVLKRLNEAIRDRDHIYSVIRASALNNDGNNKIGYTAPSVKGQADCILAAIKLAGIDPKTISYMEAHGTATKLGDSVEVHALNEAFGLDGKVKSCAIGSVKSNIGHLDIAAGVAGLIKASMSIKHRQIPASLHFEEPNPEIDFDSGPFYVNNKLTDWENRPGNPIRAGVNSLGMGGTNVHVLLEEPPLTEGGGYSKSFNVMTISAKSQKSVVRFSEKLKKFIQKNPELEPSDLAYSLQVGRKHFEYRRAFAFDSIKDLGGPESALEVSEIVKVNTQRLVFLFPGQGSQYVNMAKELYIEEPAFREIMDEGFDIIAGLTGEDFKRELYPVGDDPVSINETRYTQPIVFLLEYALSKMLLSFGIRPTYMIGHSIGEYVAACIDGVFSFEEALKIVIKRGEIMNNAKRGAMLSVGIAVLEANQYLNKDISLAAVNSPKQVVLSGDQQSIDELLLKFENLGIPCKKLYTSHAFHSHMQDELLDTFREALKKITLNHVKPSFISNVTGQIITGIEAASVDYWVRQLRETVKFSEGVQFFLSQNKEFFFLEVGAGSSLISLVKQQNTGRNIKTSSLLKSVNEEANDSEFLAARLAILWANGVEINWVQYHKSGIRNRIPLPTYAFDPIKFTAEVSPFKSGVLAEKFAISLDSDGPAVHAYQIVWKRSLLNGKQTDRSTTGYLFFNFSKDWSVPFKEELSGKDQFLIEVYISEEFEKISEKIYLINPLKYEHFTALINSISMDGFLISDIIYSWSILADQENLELFSKNETFNLCYLSFAYIVQSLLVARLLKGIKFTAITGALHNVIGIEQCGYAQSMLLGLLNVLPQEYSVSTLNIDIDLKHSDHYLLGNVINEIRNNDGKPDKFVAFRHTQRWTRDFGKLKFSGDYETKIEKRGVYLITGGLGNVGFTIAKHLIKQYDARVILVGRKDIFSKDTFHATVKERSKLELLTSLSENVKYAHIDLSSPSEFENFVIQNEILFGHINGIVHAAGIISDEYFELAGDITPEKAIDMLKPKVDGIRSIYQAVRYKNIDFVWITSSIATVLGGLGFSTYAAANLFMDHFIGSRTDELKNWKCVGLSGLALTEDEAQKDPLALNAVELIDLFERSLTIKEHLFLQSKTDLPKRFADVHYKVKDQYFDDEDNLDTYSKVSRPMLSTSFRAPETDTERKVGDIFETFLGIETIGTEDDFFELGGDSLKGMMLLKRLNSELGCDLSLKDLMFHTNVRRLGSKIDELAWLNTDLEKDNELTI